MKLIPYIKMLAVLLVSSMLVACSDAMLTYDATIEGKEILTPQAKDEPQINGASVFGVTPGKPVYYRMAVSGVRPVVYSADNLPEGLEIDAESGWITGPAPVAEGDYDIVLRAENPKGSTSKDFILRVGDVISLTPPMGWNSWYVHSEGISEKAVREIAIAMSEKGLDQYGWTFINIDDCWMGERHPVTKAIQPNEKFDDMKALAEFVNAKGFKLGIYSTAWMATFAGFIGGTAPNPEGDYSELYLPEEEILNPGQFFGRHPSSTQRGIAEVGPYWFVDRDAQQFAEWGIDYVKYDWVEVELTEIRGGEFRRISRDPVRKTHEVTGRFYNDFRSLDRDMIISLSPGHNPEEDELVSQYCNLWRLTPDIKAVWEDLTRPFSDEMVARYSLTRPGLYGDLDMLQIGPLGQPNRALEEFMPSPLTGPEQYFQLTLWSILTQPLLLSCDISTMDDFDLNLVTNREVLAVNQDPLVSQGYRVRNEEGVYEIWAKDLVDGGRALAFFNLSDEDKEITVSAEQFGKTGKVRDLWRQKDIGNFRSEFTVKVSPHGTGFFKVK